MFHVTRVHEVVARVERAEVKRRHHCDAEFKMSFESIQQVGDVGLGAEHALYAHPEKVVRHLLVSEVRAFLVMDKAEIVVGVKKMGAVNKVGGEIASLVDLLQ